jgi:hypothetical protein
MAGCVPPLSRTVPVTCSGVAHERQAAGKVHGVVAERGLGIGEPDVVPAAVLTPLNHHGRAVALIVVPEVRQLAADAEAAAARFVAVAPDVPDDDAAALTVAATASM